MGNINIAPRMARKSIVKNTSGQIIDWLDEANGGWIIRKGQIVNEEKYNEFKKIEEDKKLAAQAIAFQKVEEVVPERNVTAAEAVAQNNRMDELEKKIGEQDNKLDAILKALQK